MKRSVAILFAVACALLPRDALSSQGVRTTNDAPLPRAAMNAYFARLGRFGASGAALVMRNGRVVYRTGFGWADRARRVPMTTSTGVDIASMSKDITAIAILQLVERGKLKLSDSLVVYFDSIPADKRGITIEQLVTHRSGLPSFFVEGNDFAPLTRVQARDAIYKIPLEFKPGTEFGYSDAGYVLLGMVIEQRTGLPIEDFLQQSQFSPAQLHNTHSYGTTALRSSTSVAHGYVDSKDAGSAAAYVSNADYWVIKGAGGIVSTVEDIAAWERGLRTGALLSPGTLVRLLGPGGRDTTAGLAGPPERLPSGKRAWIRTGAQDFGFSAGVIRYADDNTIVVLALNRQPEAMDISYLRTRLLMNLDAFVSGSSPALPPETGSAATAGPRAGAYALRDGSTLLVERDAESLVVTPDGPLAVELLSWGADTTDRRHRLALAERATSVLQQLCAGNVAPLRETLARPSERLEAYLTKTACADPTSRVHAIGTVPHWWTRAPTTQPATLIAITTGEKTTRMRIEWEGDRVSAVGGGGIEAPVVRFLNARRSGQYVGYHLGIGSASSFSWSAERSNEIAFFSPDGGRIVATRIP